MTRPILDTLYLAWSLHPDGQTLSDLLTGVRYHARRAGYEFRDAADDYAQNVCLTVWKNLASFEQTTADGFTRWLRVLMKHEKLKRYADEQHISSEEMVERAVEDQEYIDIADLPEEIRKVATSLLHGYSLRETAERMKLKPDALRKKLERFRHKPPSKSA